MFRSPAKGFLDAWLDAADCGAEETREREEGFRCLIVSAQPSRQRRAKAGALSSMFELGVTAGSPRGNRPKRKTAGLADPRCATGEKSNPRPR